MVLIQPAIGSGVLGVGKSNQLSRTMFNAFKFVLGVLIAAAGLATLSQSALAKKTPTHASWYRSSDDVRCVERSFSISVGNPAYRNRWAIWPAPCRW
jgi:hypothetical protein